MDERIGVPIRGGRRKDKKNMDTIGDVWKEVLSICKTKVSDAIFKVWFEPLELVKFENNTFVLTIGSDFKRSIIEEKFGAVIKDSFQEIMGFPVDIEIIVNGAKPKKEENAKSGGTEETSDGTQQYTFDNFIIGKSNSFAFNVSLGVTNNPGTTYNPLLIYGRSGLGKTHLLLAIKNRLKEKYPDKLIIYTTGEAFMNELIECLKNQNTFHFHQKYRTVDALLIDDIQIIQKGIAVQEEFFHTFNTLQQAGKQIVITSDVPPREMEILEERLRARFEMGIMADIQPPDIDTRKAIIMRKSDELGITLPEPIIELIAQKIKNNVRQIEGSVKKIAAMTAAYSNPVTLEQAQDIIKDITTDYQPTSVTVKKIVEYMAKEFGISENDILSDKRQSNIALARQLAMYVIKEVTDLKLQELGNYFNKNHTTVLYAINQAKEKMDKNPQYKALAMNAVNEFQNRTS